MSDMTAREAIVAALDELEPDALEVLAVVAERLAMGRRTYGDLNITTDGRDYGGELLNEIADGLAYSAMALVREQRLPQHRQTTDNRKGKDR